MDKQFRCLPSRENLREQRLHRFPNGGRQIRMETKKTILIADTSEEFRTVLAEAIQAEEGLEVVGQTGDGQEAIQLVQDRDPDVLVMDLVSWSGWTALTCWRR